MKDWSGWKRMEVVDGGSGEVEQYGGRPKERGEQFSFGINRFGRHFWFHFDAGWCRPTNSHLMGARLGAEVLPGLQERCDARGIVTDVSRATLSRVDFAVDCYLQGAVDEHIKAVADRISLSRHFEQSQDLPHSKCWWTGAGRKHPRTLKLYNRMLKGGEPGVPVARFEMGLHGGRTVEQTLGIATLGELAARPEVGHEAFLKLVGPALPEPAPVESDIRFDIGGLSRAVRYDSHKIGLACRWLIHHEAGTLEAHLDEVGAAKGANAKCRLRKQFRDIEPLALAHLTPNRGRDHYALMRQVLLNPAEVAG